VQQQLEQIQDEVTRQALLSKSRSIKAILARGEIQVVVFGTGSAGKTSLVNAVMGRIVGRVDAPMETTQVGKTYCLRLKGLERN
jgi:GTPase SAR1 family protein